MSNYLSLQTLQNFLESKVPSFRTKSFVLAVSGGADSMLMLDCFRRLQLNFCAAHVNYNVRGEESHADRDLVMQYCKLHHIECELLELDPQWKSSLENQNFQHEARKVRYTWFEEIRLKRKFAFICTAHHADDQAETILFHLMRGSSLKGLRGIQPKNQNLLRPFLSLLKIEIYEDCKRLGINYREDLSNQEVDYDRNKIRKVLIPKIQDLNPSFPERLAEQARVLQEAEILWALRIKQLLKKHLRVEGSDQRLSMHTVSKIEMGESIFKFWLSQHGYSSIQAQDAFMSSQSWQTGRKMESHSHSLYRDRTDWLLVLRESDSLFYGVLDHEQQSIVMGQWCISYQTKNYLNTSTDSNTAFLNLQEIEFPLVIRNWRKGDYFYPLGLNKKKKISDFLTDQKVPSPKRKNVLVVCSGERICWVVGMRLDHRFRGEPNTDCIQMQAKKINGE